MTPLTELVLVLVLGSLAQWIAWRLRLPSILLLLTTGIVVGPIVHVIDPDALFGALLRPVVSLSVALILFEGGLSLDFRELRGTGQIVWRLVTMGMAATWIVAAVAAHYVLGLDWSVAALLGAILTVTGPTVILPLLRTVRPIGAVGPILKWEGIVIDPIGAFAAVLTFEVILIGEMQSPSRHITEAIMRMLLAGFGLGIAGAAVLVQALRRFWIPEFLQSSITLMLVGASFAASNAIQPESGLLAVTVMGIVLANQRRADVRPIVEFKENLRVLLIAAMFILLSARLEVEDMVQFGVPGGLFVLVVMFVGRPLCVLVSTLGSSLKWAERMFLMWMAPRGIVAASVASVFALELERAGVEQARLLVPATFGTIIGTVLIYGLTAVSVARRLGLAEPDAPGVLIVGAHPLARAIAATLQGLGIRAVLVDVNAENIAAARMEGLSTYHGNILGRKIMDDLDLGGIGKLLALTSNDEVNMLAVHRFGRLFDRVNAYQLPPERAGSQLADPEHHLLGRVLFRPDATYSALDRRLESGWTLRATPLTETFDYASYRQVHGDDALPMFIVTGAGKLNVITPERGRIEPRAGHKIVSLTAPRESQDRQPAAPAAPEQPA
ncbi:MAG: sodium:proton antiporter [Phycisphaerae bacterium]|nr:cation:proton antiporter [Phycisphaerae bacterium]NUQ46634.1 sodium:proton antiporter [Phycisphaerae bacterium]